MSFTIWSIFIPVSILVFFKGKKELLYLLVLTSTFSMGSIINIGSFGLEIPHFVAILLFFRLIFDNIKGDTTIVAPNFMLTSFVVIAGLSIIAAAIKNSTVMVYGIGNGVQLTAANFSTQNITQYIYLLVGFFIYWMTKDLIIKSGSEIVNIIKILVISQALLSIFAVIQIIFNNLGIPYHQLFRTMPGLTERGRIYSVTGEPSIFGQVSILILSILLSVNLFEKKRLNIYLTILVLVMGVFSASTTFYLGLVLLLCLVTIENNIVEKVKWIFGLAIMAVFIYFLINRYNPSFWSQLISDTVEKFAFENQSGSVRSSVFLYMLRLGLQNPILGVGYGTGRSTDVFSNVLATTGIFGFTSFILFFLIRIVKVCSALNGNLKSMTFFTIPVRKWAFMLLNLTAVYLCTGISCPDLLYTYLWILFAVMEVLGNSINKINKLSPLMGQR